MAQISAEHVGPLSMGFVAVVVFAIVGMGIVNYLADK
jgi:hypothetical protein